MPRRTKTQRPKVKRAVKHEINGMALHPIADPPQVTIPWWQGVLNETIYIKGPNTVSICDPSDIRVWISARWGIPVKDKTKWNQDLVFRISEVRVWEMTRDREGFGLQCYDLISHEKFMLLYQKQDVPGQVAYARLGFRWPVSNRDRVMNTDSEEKDRPIFSIANNQGVAADKSLAYKIHVNIMWKPNSIAPPGIFRMRELDPSF